MYSHNQSAKVGFRFEPPSPYLNDKKHKYDRGLATTLSGVNTMTIAPYSLEESEKMLRYYVASNIVYGVDDDVQRFVFSQPPLLRQLERKKTELPSDLTVKSQGAVFGSADEVGYNVEQFGDVKLFSADTLSEVTNRNVEGSSDGNSIGLLPSSSRLNADAVAAIEECKENRHGLWWKSFVDTKYLISGGGNPRELLDSCCMRAN